MRFRKIQFADGKYQHAENLTDAVNIDDLIPVFHDLIPVPCDRGARSDPGGNPGSIFPAGAFGPSPASQADYGARPTLGFQPTRLPVSAARNPAREGCRDRN